MRSTARRVLGPLVLAHLLAVAAGARAQSGGDASQAETLFYDGRKALDAGDNATACKKFGESLTLLRRASTLVNLAQCSSKLGKLADAQKYAQDALSLIPPEDERMGPAKALLDDISARVPRITLKLPADLPAQASVRIDGSEMERPRWAQPISLDPGEHVVSLSALPGKEQSAKVVLAERDRKEIVLDPGASAAGPAGSATGPAGSATGPAGSATGTAQGGDKVAPDGDSRATRRTIGFIAGGVGLAGLVAAGVTGGLVVANDATIQANCPNKVCNAAGRDAIAQSNTLVLVNYIAFGLGGLGVAAGAVLVLTSLGGGKEKSTVSVAASPSSLGLSWQGSFQ
jgi:hypothetical protein